MWAKKSLGAGGSICPLLSICNVFRFVHQGRCSSKLADVSLLGCCTLGPTALNMPCVFLCSHIQKNNVLKTFSSGIARYKKETFENF